MSLNDINGLLKRYLDGKCSAEESRLVEIWLEENGEENDEWKHMNDTARKQWLSYLYGDVQKSIQLKEEDKKIVNISPASGLRVWKLMTSIAAAFVIICGLYVAWPTLQDQINPVTYHELKAASGIRKLFVLDDGTRLWLNSGSSLKYPSRFNGKKREVYLQGEAYFEVAHNAETPFIVYAGKLITRVLGTSFNIKAYKDDPDVKITLFTGKVEVIRKSNNKERSKLILLPNQEATYRKDAGSLSKTTVNNSIIDYHSAWKDGKLIFDETPVSEVLKRLSLAYDVKFILADEKINGCTITGAFNVNQNIEEILKSISISMDGKFVREANEFTLTGQGCAK
ncbi:FecR family protein [Daejeonella sp.]|uniref:FecR family protein n=1 Tax=Daejeonella sp. TaxID=2805397 RepID=UPI003983D831